MKWLGWACLGRDYSNVRFLILSSFPQVKKASVRSCVLDTESVAWDREKKQIQPFQVLTTRKKKVRRNRENSWQGQWEFDRF